MKRVFITGAGGMVGMHLMQILADEQPEVSVIGTYYAPTVDLKYAPVSAKLTECDIRDANLIDTLIDIYRPDVIFHLAAQSYPVVSMEKPVETTEINICGTINLLEAVKRLKERCGYDPTVVIACSSAEYGDSLLNSEAPIEEDAPLLPVHPYGISKVAQDLLGYQYFRTDDIRTIRARIFNTTGPYKVGDMVSDFAIAATKLLRGEDDRIEVGNLRSKRAILNVTDLCSALLLLAEKGDSGEAYNICSSYLTTGKEVLSEMEKIAGRSLPCIQVDSKMRKVDEPIIWGDTAKLKALGWAELSTIKDIVLKIMLHWQKELA